MKKKILSFLTVLCTTILASAQVDITSYRGAFAPAPAKMWTEDWVNWDPQNTPYGAPNVVVSGSISSNTTWTANNVYQLSGIVYVDSLVTLTIEPGTVVRGASGNSSLLVARGGKLIAEGTPCRPIVFTSSNAPGSRTPGNWGGVLLLGRAKHNLGTQNLIEGLANTDPRNFHGGNDDNDNSGILKYVRIEYSGFIFSANNEINGLTLGSVGRGTVIDYVQVSFGDDDSFEWFGGSVNAKHLVALKGKDDDFDSDNGYSGTIQYVLGIRDPALSDASQSEGFESDNSATGIAGQLPKTSARFYNVTQIGAFRCASNANGSGVAPSTTLFRRGARVRRNSDLKIFNSILMNNWRGLFVDDAVVGSNPTQPTSVNYNEDSAAFRNNIIAGDFTTTWGGAAPYAGTQSLAYENSVSRTIGSNINYNNDSINTCSLLLDPWNANPALADFRPNVAGAGALVVDPTNLFAGTDISPIVEIDNNLFTANQATDFLVDVLENAGAATNGQIIISIPKPSGWNITVPGLTLTSTPQSGTNTTSNVSGGVLNANGGWNFYDDGINIIAVSKPGTIVPKSGFTQIGFVATRKNTTSGGTNQSLVVNVSGGSDVNPSNNSAVVGLSAN